MHFVRLNMLFIYLFVCLYHINTWHILVIEESLAFICVLYLLYIVSLFFPDFKENKISHIQNPHSWKKIQVNRPPGLHPFCRV